MIQEGLLSQAAKTAGTWQSSFTLLPMTLTLTAQLKVYHFSLAMCTWPELPKVVEQKTEDVYVDHFLNFSISE